MLHIYNICTCSHYKLYVFMSIIAVACTLPTPSFHSFSSKIFFGSPVESYPEVITTSPRIITPHENSADH